MRFNIMQNTSSGYNHEFALTFPEFNNFIGAKSSYNAKEDSLSDHSNVLTTKEGTEKYDNNYYIVDGKTMMGHPNLQVDDPSYMDGSMLIPQDSRGNDWSEWKHVTDYNKLPETVLEWVYEMS